MMQFVETVERIATKLSNEYGQDVQFNVEYDHARQPMVSVSIPRHLFEFGIVDCVDGFDDDGNSEPEYLVYFYRNEKLVSVWNSEFSGLLLNTFETILSELLDEMYDDSWEADYDSNMPCDTYGMCAGSSCKNWVKCQCK